MAIEDIQNHCKIWVKARDYSNLTNVEGDFDDFKVQSVMNMRLSFLVLTFIVEYLSVLVKQAITDVDSICDYNYKNLKEEARSKYNLK